MTSVYDNLGPACTVTDFAEDDLTPKLEYYADRDNDVFEGTPEEILLPAPEMNDNYVGARVELPRGNDMAQGRVKKPTRDNAGNPVGRADTSKDTKEYNVELEDGQEVDLAVN